MTLYESILKELDRLNELAKQNTTCHKTYVGASIGRIHNGVYVPIVEGFNSNPEYNCLKEGCYRIKKFGSDSKEYRKYCKAIHAEENALKQLDPNEYISIAVVTRYPCDNCTKLLINAKVKIVVYGREFPISEWAENEFKKHDITVIHEDEWVGDANDDNR